MSLSILEMICFVVCFVAAFYTLSGLNIEELFKNKEPTRVYLFIFLASLAMAWLCTEAILFITVYNHF